MRLDAVDDYLRAPASGTGPIAVVLCETTLMVAKTAELLRGRGFHHVITVGPGLSLIHISEPTRPY